MNKKKLYSLILLITVLICVFGFVWSWFVTRGIRSDASLNAAKTQKVSVSNLILTESKDEKIYWELYAKSGSYDSTSGLVILNDAIGNFYNKEQKVVLSVESDKGSYRESDKAIVLEGDTFIMAHDGSSIRADKIVWKGRDEDIVASGNVVVRRNDEFLATSNKAVFSYDFTKFRIEENCVTNVYTPQGQKDKTNGFALSIAPNKGDNK